MKATDYKDIGLYLKDVRESLRLSIEEAAHALNMRAHYLKALESGEYGILPGKAYIRGYIKNYALLLGIDSTELLTSYDALSTTVKYEHFIPEPTIRENLPSRAVVYVLLIAVALTFGYYGLYGNNAEIATKPVPDVTPEVLQAVESTRHAKTGEWKDCLNSKDKTCFHTLLTRDILAGIEKDYRKTLWQLTQVQ